MPSPCLGTRAGRRDCVRAFVVTPKPPPGAVSGRQIASGAAWMMLFKIVDKGIGLISTLILARLLMPADFGLVAMATAVLAFTQLMSAFGFDTALIQRQDASRPHYDTAWTFNVIFGSVIAVLLLLLSVPTAHFYGEPRLTPILIVLAAGTLVGGFENIGTVAFRKELDFRSEFRYMLFKRLASFVVTLTLAFTLRSYWALVVGIVTGRAASVWISYRLHPFRPRLSLAKSADMMHFSKWIFVSSLIQFLQNRSTDFILGRTVGSHGLGVYNIAFEIASMPASEVIAPINRAAYPAYARLAVDPSALLERFLSIYAVISMVCFPIVALLFFIAEPAVHVVLGPKWLETIPLLRLLVVCGLMYGLHSNIYTLLVAVGKPQANTLVQTIVLLVSLPAIVYASLRFGVMGAAYAQVGASVVSFVAMMTVFRSVTGSGVGKVCLTMLRPLLAATAMGLLVLGLDLQLLSGGIEPSSPLRLLALCIAGILSHALAAWVLWRAAGSPLGPEVSLVNMLRERLLGARKPVI